MLQLVPVSTCTPVQTWTKHTERYKIQDTVWVLLLCSALTGYRSPLNDFQRSEGRELVPTAWNAARVVLLPGINLEDCATRCSQSLDCRYPTFTLTQQPYHRNHFIGSSDYWFLLPSCLNIGAIYVFIVDRNDVNAVKIRLFATPEIWTLFSHVPMSKRESFEIGPVFTTINCWTPHWVYSSSGGKSSYFWFRLL